MLNTWFSHEHWNQTHNFTRNMKFLISGALLKISLANEKIARDSSIIEPAVVLFDNNAVRVGSGKSFRIEFILKFFVGYFHFLEFYVE